MSTKGSTLLEVIASFFILSLIVVTAMSFLVNARLQTSANQHKQVAMQEASLIRSEILATASYADVQLWIAGEEKILDSTNCTAMNPPFACTIFDSDYSIQLIFPTPTTESINLSILYFTIQVVYFQTRTITIEGIIYE